MMTPADALWAHSAGLHRRKLAGTTLLGGQAVSAHLIFFWIINIRLGIAGLCKSFHIVNWLIRQRIQLFHSHHHYGKAATRLSSHTSRLNTNVRPALVLSQGHAHNSFLIMRFACRFMRRPMDSPPFFSPPPSFPRIPSMVYFWTTIIYRLFLSAAQEELA
ncbi:hypothetical protein BDZ89DRAFT_374492 [Hymenopellis radicata]|nr:hypothetical protein BDZ89DRAFT_374492 [Hymenopellis radicata]